MTKIEWTDETWNPVTGCSPISPGCKNCYAKRMARRLAGRFGYPEAPNHFNVTLHPDRLEQPLKWKKPRVIFVCSMSDLFHEDVPDEFILRVFDTIAITPQHTYQILTKRPVSMRDWYEKMTLLGYLAVEEPDGRISNNVWFGVTAENQTTADERIPILLQIPAAVRIVSIEPMLEEIDLSYYLTDQCGYYCDPPTLEHYERMQTMPHPTDGHYDHRWEKIDQVICGAETGPGKRPMKLDWARSLRNQCQAANVPFFFKKDSDGNRELDGRLWEEYPK